MELGWREVGKFRMCFGSRITGHARGLRGRREGEGVKKRSKLQCAGEAYVSEGDVGLE